MLTSREPGARPWRSTRALAAALLLGLVLLVAGLPGQAVAASARGPWAGLGPGPGTAVTAPPSGTWRLMVSGDSITRGVNGDTTWRQRLWEEFGRQGVPLRLVGPLSGPNGRGHSAYFANARFAAADHHHAVPGARLDTLGPGVGKVVAKDKPDVLHVMLGANDLRRGASPARAEALMRTYLSNALRARPRLKVLVSPVLPSLTYPGGQPRDFDVPEANARFATLVRKLSSSGYDAHWVDPAAADFSPRDHTYDGVHLDPTGERLFAHRVAAALHADGVLPGEPVLPTDPTPWVTQARAGVTTSPGTAVLSWATWDRRLTTDRMLLQVVGPTPSDVRRVTGGYQSTSKLLQLAPGSYTVTLEPVRKWMVGTPGPATAFTVP
ncbi:GDSL-like Lipase/Acylhydrolase family protein [Nocardioides scoriae]|uniref:GDSL-like Lipase/Acylhydrolase family protein n=1 Tax=Nocardioides scoriae TaxID=642780 RepID=A0A1H1NEN8_9ACTN|nr:GDSL-type esterase/lipase family protein [Nocardioides scoriae]SDR97418.1 GDSL-like Lipase/Acylhydrolase family protein [Nocardioides scoriae]